MPLTVRGAAKVGLWAWAGIRFPGAILTSIASPDSGFALKGKAVAKIDAVFLFHGLGSKADDMRNFGRLLLSQAGQEAKIVSMQGECNFGDSQSPCWGWFAPPNDRDRDFEVAEPPSFAGLEDSVQQIHAAINRICSEGAGSHRIHLIGHSQGGAVALAAGLTYGLPLASVCTIAGYLALTPSLQPVTSGTTYTLHHCVNDENVSFRWAGYAQERIKRIGEPCTVVEYPASASPHGIQIQQVRNIAESLRKIAAGS